MPKLATMPELEMYDAWRGNLWNTVNASLHLTLHLTPPLSLGIEFGYGNHAEGSALSARTRSCVEAVRQR